MATEKLVESIKRRLETPASTRDVKRRHKTDDDIDATPIKSVDHELHLQVCLICYCRCLIWMSLSSLFNENRENIFLKIHRTTTMMVITKKTMVMTIPRRKLFVARLTVPNHARSNVCLCAFHARTTLARGWACVNNVFWYVTTLASAMVVIARYSATSTTLVRNETFVAIVAQQSQVMNLTKRKRNLH